MACCRLRSVSPIPSTTLRSTIVVHDAVFMLKSAKMVGLFCFLSPGELLVEGQELRNFRKFQVVLSLGLISDSPSDSKLSTEESLLTPSDPSLFRPELPNFLNEPNFFGKRLSYCCISAGLFIEEERTCREGESTAKWSALDHSLSERR
eukprot:Lithocolla_globosa_v1_NODE_1976_length_2233_cov_7.825528.p2 type:complete len:149 gc:universal NODE_1976_length_2233_cov_7.825528:1611-2057(+)